MHQGTGQVGCKVECRVGQGVEGALKGVPTLSALYCSQPQVEWEWSDFFSTFVSYLIVIVASSSEKAEIRFTVPPKAF